MENERITKLDIAYTATNIKNELDSFTISQAFNKLQRYECLGTVDEFKALKEKSVAKKSTEFHEDDVCIDFICPGCKEAVYGQPYKPKYCKHCGQKLDWSE